MLYEVELSTMEMFFYSLQVIILTSLHELRGERPSERSTIFEK